MPKVNLQTKVLLYIVKIISFCYLQNLYKQFHILSNYSIDFIHLFQILLSNDNVNNEMEASCRVVV